MLHLNIEYENKILFVRLKGNLTSNTCYKINNYINPLLKKHGITKIIYNMEYLNDIDLSGIESLYRSKKIIKENHGKILLCEVNNKVKYKLLNLNIKKINKEDAAVNYCEA